MSTDGWVNTSIKTADYMFSHFFLSDYSQTAEFSGDVASFSYIVERYADDLSAMAQQIQSNLAAYFSTQFSNVDIQASTIQNIQTTINVYELTLYLTFTDTDGVTFNLSRLVQYAGLKVVDIIAVINHG